MILKLDDVKEEDRGILGSCGILCSGCDYYIGEGLEAAKILHSIWEGWNMIDVGSFMGLNREAIKVTLKTLKNFIKTNKRGNCVGCFQGSFSSKVCGIAKCVKTKGYWTCAECEDYDPELETPCPHINSSSIPITDKGQWMKMICTRYSRNNTQNLKKCREIGYLAFIKEAKEKVAKGWRTWQIISKEMVFTNEHKKE
ncbi:MAG: DUF3795 domain-containing protein [Promethearchaeota archaeon]